VFGAVVFVGLILFLLSTIGWVEHTDRVTRSASELQRRSIDMETGLRGFLITGEESFLEPYQSALPRLKPDTDALRKLVSDNPQQVERVDRIAGLQDSLERVRPRHDCRPPRRRATSRPSVRLGRGKRLTDDMRAEYTAFMDTEQALRFQRNNDANRTSVVDGGPVPVLHADADRAHRLLRPPPAGAAVGQLRRRAQGAGGALAAVVRRGLAARRADRAGGRTGRRAERARHGPQDPGLLLAAPGQQRRRDVCAGAPRAAAPGRELRVLGRCGGLAAGLLAHREPGGPGRGRAPPHADRTDRGRAT
jgi:CHASE3 domain sensor protein